MQRDTEHELYMAIIQYVRLCMKTCRMSGGAVEEDQDFDCGFNVAVEA